MITLEQAWEQYASTIQPLPATMQVFEVGAGQVLAQELRSKIDLPPFRQSAMDGYALRSADLAKAADDCPVHLPCQQYIPAGREPYDEALSPGHCARIFTGGAVPSGADAVVMQERCDAQGEQIVFRAPVAIGNNIRAQGEELPSNSLLAPSGRPVDSQLLSVASIAGLAGAVCRSPPTVSVIVTGDELVSPGLPLRTGQVYECNGRFLQAWLQAQGVPTRVVQVPDRPPQIKQALEAALHCSDLVLMSGGASVGDRDFAREVASGLRVREHFWRVAQKPGKPLAFGMAQATPVLMLPGNPAAVFVCAWLHVLPVLNLLRGMTPALPVWKTGKLDQALNGSPGRDRFLRVSWDFDAEGAARVRVLPGQASHMLTNLVQTNGLLRVAAGDALQADEVVRFLPLSNADFRS